MRRPSFAEDFRRFFTRGLATVLPTLITLWLLLWVWNFLWDSLGRHIIWLIKWGWLEMVQAGAVQFQPPGYIGRYWDPELYPFRTRLLGVTLAILLVYIVGVFVGNLIGRTAWRMAERGVMRIPLVRAIYPAVKQVTDFVLADRSAQFKGSHVVAVQPHAEGIWSVGVITGHSNWALRGMGPEEMVTVFVPSTPTAFSGYVLVVPRGKMVELPMSVEEAFRLLISGGVIMPGTKKDRRPIAGSTKPAAAGAALSAEVPAFADESSAKGEPFPEGDSAPLDNSAPATKNAPPEVGGSLAVSATVEVLDPIAAEAPDRGAPGRTAPDRGLPRVPQAG